MDGTRRAVAADDFGHVAGAPNAAAACRLVRTRRRPDCAGANRPLVAACRAERADAMGAVCRLFLHRFGHGGNRHCPFQTHMVERGRAPYRRGRHRRTHAGHDDAHRPRPHRPQHLSAAEIRAVCFLADDDRHPRARGRRIRQRHGLHPQHPPFRRAVCRRAAGLRMALHAVAAASAFGWAAGLN